MKAALSNPDLCCPLKSKQEKSTARYWMSCCRFPFSHLPDSEHTSRKRVKKASIHLKLINLSVYLWCCGAGVHLFLVCTRVLQRLLCIFTPKAVDYCWVRPMCLFFCALVVICNLGLKVFKEEVASNYSVMPRLWEVNFSVSFSGVQQESQ